MRKQDFQFELPAELIAEKPSKQRSGSRLLIANPKSNQLSHKVFADLVEHLNDKDCLIFNNTRVIPARLIGKRESGGKVEVLIERLRAGKLSETCIAQVRASNTPKAGAIIIIDKEFQLEVVSRIDGFFELRNLSNDTLATLVDRFGEMPLPPYIERQADEFDKERYQTVYAKNAGAVAAPTAGLHFDEQLLNKIEAKGVQHDFVTLHVGAGTFSPVRVDDISEHKMHSEWFNVPESVVSLVAETRASGGRVIAVGTTSVRCLESASISGTLRASSGETNIFITPGYQFKSVDALVTNFHLSESTLIMLVSALAGREFILNAYYEAITESYRFFSYGDSMFIENRI
ncbi:MAG: tRNA preQ1(34) S-adenosylmethionine ribosyltransferase-isomerase QueA [Kangiellaceae bacterium]|nr:tRNA preQ1(34) S-adenosylmethionine ribosyltransferase-isomerase QueA [Kangiellaceae bacterium]